MRGVSAHALRLTEDRFAPHVTSARTLAPCNRVLYVLAGDITLKEADAAVHIVADTARHSDRACQVEAGGDGATVLRYELVRAGTPEAETGGISRRLLEHPIVLDERALYLMRCDRVDFDLGGVALPHRHQGGGIRCLIAGTMELRVEGEPDRIIHPGQAWFESGREPVYAAASRDTPTAFVRCSILPRAIEGQSSIIYVDPEDARRGRPRKYTVHVDEPIELM